MFTYGNNGTYYSGCLKKSLNRKAFKCVPKSVVCFVHLFSAVVQVRTQRSAPTSELSLATLYLSEAKSLSGRRSVEASHRPLALHMYILQLHPMQAL